MASSRTKRKAKRSRRDTTFKSRPAFKQAVNPANWAAVGWGIGFILPSQVDLDFPGVAHPEKPLLEPSPTSTVVADEVKAPAPIGIDSKLFKGAGRDANPTSGLLDVSLQLIGDLQVKAVDARGLWAFLDVPKDFSIWIRDQLWRYNFTEHLDYTVLDSPTLANQSGRHGDREAKTFMLTLDTAKDLAMVQHTAKGMEAQQYLHFLLYGAPPLSIFEQIIAQV